MVTIYTERGRVSEYGVMETEVQKNSLVRLASICLGTGLLLSLVAAYNLSAEVNDLTANKIPYIQDRLSQINPAALSHQ